MPPFCRHLSQTVDDDEYPEEEELWRVPLPPIKRNVDFKREDKVKVIHGPLQNLNGIGKGVFFFSLTPKMVLQEAPTFSYLCNANLFFRRSFTKNVYTPNLWVAAETYFCFCVSV